MTHTSDTCGADIFLEFLGESPFSEQKSEILKKLWDIARENQ